MPTSANKIANTSNSPEYINFAFVSSVNFFITNIIIFIKINRNKEIVRVHTLYFCYNNSMSRKEAAINYFKEGYNCSQSVVLAFQDLLTIDAKELCKIASPFGGGISRMRETCGAVSGMVIVIGNLKGYETPETGEAKAKLYKTTQDLLLKFEKRFGSLTCRNLLNLSVKHDDPNPSNRDHSFFDKRPCIELIGGAVEILEEFLTNNEI